MRLPKALYRNNPPILTVGSSEAGNETMLGKPFKACNVKTRLHSTPTEDDLKVLLPDIDMAGAGTVF